MSRWLPLDLRFDLHDHGWADLTTTSGDNTFVCTFGYCTDALGDLLRAAIGIATCETCVQVRLDNEPQEWLVIYQRRSLDADEVDLKVLDDTGAARFEATCAIHDLVKASARMARRVLGGTSLAAYKANWLDTDFPTKELDALEELKGHA